MYLGVNRIGLAHNEAYIRSANKTYRVIFVQDFFRGQNLWDICPEITFKFNHNGGKYIVNTGYISLVVLYKVEQTNNSLIQNYNSLSQIPKAK